MKTSHLLLAFTVLILFTACNQSGIQKDMAYAQDQLDASFSDELFVNADLLIENNQQLATVTNGGYVTRENKKLIPLKDPASSMVIGTLEVPNSWYLTKNNAEILLEGPGGIKVYKEIVASFYHSSDSKMNEMIRANGSIVKPLMMPDDLFQRDFKPLAEGQGNKLMASYPLKEIAANDSRIDGMYYKPNPVITSFHTTVSEWEDVYGNPSIVVIKHQMANYGEKLTNWGYKIISMEADRSNYQQAKKDFLHALISYEANPAYIERINENTRKSTSNN